MPPAQWGLRAWATPARPVAPSPTAAITPMARDFTTPSFEPVSRQPVPVDGQAERGAEILGRLARGHHPRHKDLEVLHHLGDAGVDRQLQGNPARGLFD